MRVTLDDFLAQVKSIERTLDLRDRLVYFGQQRPSNLNPSAIALRKLVRKTGQSGLQPTLDASVLLLTAAFEQFIADAMVAYTDNLPTIIPVYRNVPRAIRRANERYTGEALNQRRSRFEEYERRSFVENLRNCHAGIIPYVLNGKAIALNNRNMDSDNLEYLFNCLAVGNVWNLVSSTRSLQYWSGPGGARIAKALAKNRLNELISTRNDIAHRVGTANPGPQVVRNYIKFQRALARALVKGLENRAASL